MSDVIQTIARVRRTMPRNVDVMLVCDRCEELERAITVRPKVDRKTYMREFMRRKRAADAVRRKAEQREEK